MTFQLKILLSLFVLFFSETLAGNLTQRVNPFIGTDAHGHTFPGATVPFGMVQLSPDTRVEGWDACSGYHYSDSTILGFSHTHLSGTGVADYGDILITPEVTDTLLPLKFNHQNEYASPGYYRVSLDDGKIGARLTTTTRVGFHQYAFTSDREYIFINLHHGLGPDSVLESNIQIVNDHEIAGLRRSTGWAKDQYVYFDAQFSKPIISSGISINDTLRSGSLSASGTNLKIYAQFSASPSKRLLVKVGISSVSIENARKNLQSEIPGWNFNEVKYNAEKLWEKELSKITVEGGSKDQRTTFYTALYHVMIAPNVFSDVDGSYRGMDGKIHTADGFIMYTVFSLWDTFRAEHPLLTIIDQKRTLDFIKSFLAKYGQSGILPVWELASNETWCMIGYHSVPVIVDAYAKGIRNFDAEKALTAMEHSANLDHYGLEYYRKNGYIPGEKEPESVSKTLEYSYDDWCIARMCDLLGRPNYEDFSNRAQFYKNIFDPSTGFMRPKVNGDWLTPFDPTAVTNYYTEANAWQYTFFVPQDIDGMIDLYGGKDRFIQKLDLLFTVNPVLTGRNQADISGMIGEYAQGNEPSHH
ncbi:MAG TPA: GH92 family glycosyl hydrolase, partial [Bacteroidota bacterium]|nr:GH92 family glycosyl hydrolase [Bacteroidota bacterium]